MGMGKSQSLPGKSTIHEYSRIETFFVFARLNCHSPYMTWCIWNFRQVCTPAWRLHPARDWWSNACAGAGGCFESHSGGYGEVLVAKVCIWTAARHLEHLQLKYPGLCQNSSHTGSGAKWWEESMVCFLILMVHFFKHPEISRIWFSGCQGRKMPKTHCPMPIVPRSRSAGKWMFILHNPKKLFRS